jgi:hypothetical protein
MKDEYKIQPPEASEVKEPTTPYYAGRLPAATCYAGTRAEADALAASVLGRPDGGDEEPEFGDYIDPRYAAPAAPDGRDWGSWRLDNDPEFRAFVDRRAEEAIARWKAGERTYTTDEVCDRILQCIETGNWDEILGDDA